MEEIKRQKTRNTEKCLRSMIFLAGVFCSGIFAALLAAKVNGCLFGLYTWPLIASVDLFVFTTAGFFTSEGKEEILYGGCSIAGAVCTMVQLAILF